MDVRQVLLLVIAAIVIAALFYRPNSKEMYSGPSTGMPRPVISDRRRIPITDIQGNSLAPNPINAPVGKNIINKKAIEKPPGGDYPWTVEYEPTNSNDGTLQAGYPIGKKMIHNWTTHILYTRLMIIAYYTDDTELNLIMNRLIQNQRDIGSAFGAAYGDEAGRNLTTSLLRHIQLITRVCREIQYGTEVDQQDAINLMYQNAYTMGASLDLIYHSNKFRYHFQKLVDVLIDNINYYISNDYEKDILFLDHYVKWGLEIAGDF